MGIINSANLLGFKSSQQLFDRIKKRLSSFDAMGLIDDGDFHKHVKYILEQLGKAVYKECEAVLPLKDFKTRLPKNFAYLYAAYRCSFSWHGTKTINEQRPWIYYTDTEITENPNECCINCCDEGPDKTKIVIRTYVNGDSETCTSKTSPILLSLSSNVRDMCTEDCLSLYCPGNDEITITDGYIYSMFTDDSIYMQYYGLPMDENGLPMIPENENVEKAIEYYIYTQLFEEFYWNSTVPNMREMKTDASMSYDFHMGMARYWAKLPSFQSGIQSIRRQRSNKKFYNFIFDRTVIR